jgi:integrase-like protein
VHRALDQAVAWRLIERNAATSAVLPRRTRPSANDPEARRFLNAASGHPLEALFILALTTGLRQGELLGLRWRDVDWAARRILVHHTLVRIHGRWWLGEPKTAKSERSVALTDPTVDLLRTHRAHQAERLLAIGHRVTDDDFVFSDDAGEPLWGRHVTTREFQPLLRQAELPPIRFHDLRDTFATLQLAAGTSPKIVSEVLGHKDMAIILDRYSHAMPTMQAESMGRLDAMLGRLLPDAPDVGDDEAQATELWLDADPAAYRTAPSERDKGAEGGPRPTKRPNLNSDRAENREVGTAYRIRTGDLRLERAVSWASRRMRRCRRGVDPPSPADRIPANPVTPQRPDAGVWRIWDRQRRWVSRNARIASATCW